MKRAKTLTGPGPGAGKLGLGATMLYTMMIVVTIVFQKSNRAMCVCVFERAGPGAQSSETGVLCPGKPGLRRAEKPLESSHAGLNPRRQTCKTQTKPNPDASTSPAPF